jgi:hypothetical protein
MENMEIQQTNTAVATMNPGQLLQMAIESDADLEKLEKLMDLQERWEKKQAEKDFYHAKAMFIAEKPVIPRTKTSKQNGNKYAPLGITQEKIDPVASKFGFSYRWTREQTETTMTVSCVVTHVSGHSEITSMSGPYDSSGNKNMIQGTGSSDSYLRRYTLTSAFGITIEDDDDGQGHKDPKPKPRPNKKQYTEIMKRINAGTVDLATVQQSFSLTEDQRNGLKALLEAKPKEE